MNKRIFYKEKISLFKEYIKGYPDKDLLTLYNEWIEENNIYGIDRHEIWRRAKKLRKRKIKIIKEGSEECIRLRAVLDILLQADLDYLNKLLLEKKKY